MLLNAFKWEKLIFLKLLKPKYFNSPDMFNLMTMDKSHGQG